MGRRRARCDGGHRRIGCRASSVGLGGGALVARAMVANGPHGRGRRIAAGRAGRRPGPVRLARSGPAVPRRSPPRRLHDPRLSGHVDRPGTSGGAGGPAGLPGTVGLGRRRPVPPPGGERRRAPVAGPGELRPARALRAHLSDPAGPSHRDHGGRGNPAGGRQPAGLAGRPPGSPDRLVGGLPGADHHRGALGTLTPGPAPRGCRCGSW